MSSLPPPPAPPPATPADPYAGLLRSVAAERVRDAASTRRRTHWLLRQSEEEGTFTGVLADLAERGESIVCTTRAARRHLGELHALGVDFVTVRGAGGSLVLVALEAVASVRTQPGAGVVTGDRVVQLERRLGEVLADIAGDRPDVVVATGASEVRGELRAVGRDVVTVRITGQQLATAYLSLAAIDEVRVR